MKLLSIVIPTHNRSKYAIKTIETLLMFPNLNDIEIVVADSSENNLISEKFESIPHVIVVQTEASISVVDNFNSGLNAAKGEYIIFIGDDDFLLPEIVSIAEWAKKQDVESVKFTFPVTYYWPDFEHKRTGDAMAGALHIMPFTGKIQSHNVAKALNKAIINLGSGVKDMPRAYLGMLSRKLVNNIINKHGALFGGVSPDIYSAALIAQEVSRGVKIDFPAIIPGVSGASTSGQSANGQHIGKLRENPHIGAFKNLVWDDRIPEFYSVPTVWSFSLLKAIEANPLLLKNTHFMRLYLKCYLNYTDFHHQTNQTLKKYFLKKSKFFGIFSMGFAILKELQEFLIRVYCKLRFLFYVKKFHHQLEDVQAASKQLSLYLKETGVTLQLGSNL